MNYSKKSTVVLSVLLAASSAFSIKIGSKEFTIKDINGGENASIVRFNHDLHAKYLHWTNFTLSQNLVLPWVEKKQLNEIVQCGRNGRFLIETTDRKGEVTSFLEKLEGRCKATGTPYCNIDVRRPFIESFDDLLLEGKEETVQGFVSRIRDVKKQMDKEVEGCKNQNLVCYWEDEMEPEIKKNIEALSEELKPLAEKSDKIGKDVLKKCFESLAARTSKLLDINAALEIDKELRKKDPENLHICAGYCHTYNVSLILKKIYPNNIIKEEKEGFNDEPATLNLLPKELPRMLVRDQIDKYPLPRFVTNWGSTITSTLATMGLAWYFSWFNIEKK